MERFFIAASGVRLEAARWDPAGASGPVVVLLHEGLGSVSSWRDFPQRVAAVLGLPVFAYSRQGYGGSDAIALPRPLDYLEREAALLPAVLAAAGVSEAVLLGHSDGGTIALLAAAQGDGNLRGVVAMAPHTFVEDKAVAGIRAAAEAYRTGSLRARLSRHHGSNVEGAFWGWNRAWLDPHFRRWDIRPSLAAIRVPVLVIQGEDDEYGTAAQVDAVTQRVRGARGLLLPGCGHSPQRDKPGEVLAAVARFVQDCRS